MDEPISVPQKAPKGRSSIALLMTIVFLVAADIAIVRSVWNGPGPSPAYLAMVLPMANFLLLILPRLKRPGDGRGFWLVFEVAGWGMILLLAYMDFHAKQILFFPFFRITEFAGYPVNSTSYNVLGLSSCILLFTPIQLVAAWLGGWLWTLPAKYRIEVKRR